MRGMEASFAKAIRTEHISCSAEGIDEHINHWLEQNPDVEVMDIKFTSSATNDSWGTEALIIYRTN